MKLSILSVAFALGLGSAAPAQELEKRISGVRGFDISHYQGNVDFVGAYNSGARFVIIKVSFRVQIPYEAAASTVMNAHHRTTSVEANFG